ncbi:MAG: VTT domain-containing protein [Methylococcales bacterium]|nr:VTT domain-containing protein [Methylococcales bacterium]
MRITKHSLALSALLLIGFISWYFADAMTLANILHHKDWLSTLIDEHYALTVMAFFIACALFINSPLPLAAVIKVLGGYFFGVYLGALFNILATVNACLLGFALSRYAFKSAFEAHFLKKLEEVEDAIERNGFYYFLSLRLMMVVPYFLINFVAGISRISFRHYFASSLLGVIPASIIYANGGSKLEQISSLTELFQGEVIGALLLILTLSLTPLILKRYQSHHKKP